MAIEVSKVNNTDDLEVLFRIREEVFVIEQQVAPEEEYDEYEERSTHFLAKFAGEPVATARWRFTEKGVKLERFAVLQPYRGKGVGQALVRAVLADIDQNPAADRKVRYLHAQLTATGLYEKFGFEKVGDLFEECNILHFKMQLEPPVGG